MNRMRFIRLAVCGIVLAAVLALAGCGSEAKKEYDKAMESFEEGKYNEANLLFAKAIKLDPDNAQYHVDYGMSLLAIGEYDHAREKFLGVIRDSDKKSVKKINKQAYRGIALSYYKSGIFEQAKAYFGLALETNVLSDLNNDIKGYQAECEMYMGNYDAALKGYTDLIDNAKGTSDEEDAAYYIGRANVYSIRGDYSLAIEDYKHVIKHNKRCYQAYLGEYLAAKACNDTETAAEAMDDVLSMKAKTSEDKYYLGAFNYYKGNLDAAKELLDESIKEGYYAAKFYLGRISQQKGEYEAAINIYKDYITNVPSGANAEYYNQLAGCYMELDDYNSAINCFEKGYSLSGGTLKQQITFNLVIAYEKNDNYKKALLYAERYLENYEDADMVKEYEFIKTRYREESKK